MCLGSVTDFDFSLFDDNLLCTGAEDGVVSWNHLSLLHYYNYYRVNAFDTLYRLSFGMHPTEHWCPPWALLR